EGFSHSEVRAFAAWLRSRWATEGDVLPRRHRATLNLIIDECRRACVWFLQQFALREEPKPLRMVELGQMIEVQLDAWKESRHRIPKEFEAGDLADDEIQRIEDFLKPGHRANHVEERVAVRDYLVWRLAIEFGMRRSEIAALRL